MGQAPKQKEASRLSALRKYIPTPQDAEVVKEMIADGLSDEDILHALGYVSGAPKVGALPNGHDHSNVMTTEQEEAQAAEGQPGEVVGGGEEDEEGSGEGDMLTHVAGLLSHVAKGKSGKNGKGPGTSGNR